MGLRPWKRLFRNLLPLPSASALARPPRQVGMGKLQKKPPSSYLQHQNSSSGHHHSYSIATGGAADGRFDSLSLGSKKSSASLKRAASARSSPRYPPPATSQLERPNPSPILQNGEFLPSSFSPSPKPPAAAWDFPPTSSGVAHSQAQVTNTVAVAGGPGSNWVELGTTANGSSHHNKNNHHHHHQEQHHHHHHHQPKPRRPQSYQPQQHQSQQPPHHHASPQLHQQHHFPVQHHQQQSPGSGGGIGTANSGFDYYGSPSTAPSSVHPPSFNNRYSYSNHANNSDHRTPANTAAPYLQQHQHARDHRLSDPHLQPLSSQTAEELVGAPFDGSFLLNHIEATKSTSPSVPHYSKSLRRPGPPPLVHAQTSPDARHHSPDFRQSASFAADLPMAMSLSEKAQQGRGIGDNQSAGPKRYSDETKEPKVPGLLRKKTGLSGLVSTLVGSPKKPVISAPENPVHVTHVGYDSSTGQFTVRCLFLFCLFLYPLSCCFFHPVSSPVIIPASSDRTRPLSHPVACYPALPRNTPAGTKSSPTLPYEAILFCRLLWALPRLRPPRRGLALPAPSDTRLWPLGEPNAHPIT